MSFRFLYTVSVVLISIFVGSVSGETGFSDDFSSGLGKGWKGDSQYRLEVRDGVLNVKVAKFRKWKAFSLDLGGTYDFSSQPYLSLRIKNEMPFILHIYMVDGNNKNTIIERRILQSDSFVSYGFDFSGSKNKIDMGSIRKILFCLNGAAMSLTGTFEMDDLAVGSSAGRIANIGPVRDQINYQDSKDLTVRITEIDTAASIRAQVQGRLLKNIRTRLDSGKGHAFLTYDLKEGASGTESVTITAAGKDGAGDNSISFNVTVEKNNPPTVNPVENLSIASGREYTIRLSGISDGNISREQPLTITAESDSPEIIANPVSVRYDQGSPYAYLVFRPDGSKKGVNITVCIDDSAGGESRRSMSFKADVFETFNNPPSLSVPAGVSSFLGEDVREILITGVSDGDDENQNVTVTAETEPKGVIDIVSIREQGKGIRALSYKPLKQGKCRAILNAKDDGGDGKNNGDMSSTVSFPIEIRKKPLTGCAVPVEEYQPGRTEPWKLEGEGPGQTAEVGSFMGKDNVLKITCKAKGTWSGLWYDLPELDLTEYPYLSFDVYSEKPIKIHSYLFDIHGMRNLPGAHKQRKDISPGAWHSLVMDFRGTALQETDKGKSVDFSRIDKLLFNYHPKFGWPFTEFSGAVYITNIKVGSAVANIEKNVPVCTIRPVPDLILLEGRESCSVQLRGITAGDGKGLPRISAKSSKPGFADVTRLSDVGSDGTAQLELSIRKDVDEASVTLIVEADGSDKKETGFRIRTLSREADRANKVRVDLSKTFQTIRGFGTFTPPASYIGMYTHDLGASAVRITSKTLELQNDNSDPDVIYRKGFNYNAVDFRYLEKLKKAGVETFIFTYWSPPAWMKDNLSENYMGGATQRWEKSLNRLSPWLYDEFAEQCAALVKIVKEEAGVDLYALCAQNEPAFCEPYGSGILDPEHFAKLNAVIGKRFEREDIQTKLFMPEQVFSQGFYPMKDYIDAVQADKEADNYTDIIATHGYAEDGMKPGIPDYSKWDEMWRNANEGPNPKEMWMSETGVNGNTWAQAMKAAGAIHGALAHGHISLWTSWAIEGQLISKGRPLHSFHAVKHFYKFVRPGAKMVDAGCDNGEILVTAFVNDEAHGGTLAVILINKTGKEQAVHFSIKGGPRIQTYDVYQSTEKRGCEKTAETKGLVALPASSITTIVSK